MGGSVLPSAALQCPLLLVDGHNLLWRAAFGFPAEIRTRDKQRVITGLFGFFALLRVGIRDDFTAQPEIIVVFDGQHGSNERRETAASYKAQRPTDDAALAPIKQLPQVKDGLDHTGIAWAEIETAEADDVIASLVHAAPPGRQITVMSGDRDYYQLINENVTVLNTARKTGRRRIGSDDVRAEFSVTPAQWPDYRALTGDPADNIPGVTGIGAKTAAALLAGNLTLDDLPGTGRLDTGRGRTVRDQLDVALKWRDMIRLITTMPVPVTPTGKASEPLPKPALLLEDINAW